LGGGRESRGATEGGRAGSPTREGGLFGQASRPKIYETKRRLNGTSQTFECDLIYRNGKAMVIKYESKGPFRAFASMSEGYYWEGRNYLIYKMFRDGELVGHRFDVCRDVTFGPNSVAWTDLILDFFFTTDGELQVHDEDELQEAMASGRVTPEDLAIIDTTRALLTADVLDIVREAAEVRAKAKER